jgi:protein phosphatase PTC1
MDSIEEVTTHEVIPRQTTEQLPASERDTRSEVIEAYNKTFESFKSESVSILSPEEEAVRKAEINLAERIKSETIDRDKKFVKRTYTDRAGQEVTFTESPPVRPLLEHITRVLDDPNTDSGTRDQFENYRDILYRNSRLRAYTPSQMEARMDHELNLHQNNSNLTTGNENLDNKAAASLFAFRFDLILPKKEKTQPEQNVKDSPIDKSSNRLKPQHNADGSPVEQNQFPEGAGEIPAHQINESLGEEASNPQREAQDEGEQPRPEAQDSIPTLIWRNNEYDEPVKITGYLGTDTAGREYVSIEGSSTGIPLDEIDAPPEIIEKIKELRTSSEPRTQTTNEEFPEGAGEISGDRMEDFLGEPIASSEEVITPPFPDTTTAKDEIEESIEEEKPIPLTVEEIRREIYVVNRTVDLRKRAAELAEKHLRDEQRRGKLWNPATWARKSKLRILEEYYRQKFMKEASEKMLESNNSYLSMDVFKNAAVDATNTVEQERAAGKAKIDQLKTGELTEGQKVTTVKGELKTFILNDLILNNDVTEENIQQKLREFVIAHQNDPQIKDEGIFGTDATRYGELAQYFATDILETRKMIQEDLAAHRYANDQIAKFVNIKLANVNWAADTEFQWTLADNAIAWSQRNGKRGFLTNPAVVGAATAIGLYGGMRAAGYSGKALIAAPLVGTAIGAAFSAVRRAHDLKVDRASHQVEMAYGDPIPQEDAKRRKALEKFALETTSVATLLRGGQERTTVGGDTRGMRELMGLDLSTVENRQALLQRMAEIRTRLDYSTTQKVDLITYDSRETIEQGRLELIKTLVEGKKKLMEAGIDEDQITSEQARLYGEWSRQFLKDRENQDKAFNRYRVKQSLITAGIGGATGLVVGLGISTGIREAVEHLDGHAYIPGLEKVPGLNKLTGKPHEVHQHMKDLYGENKPTKVGDLSISTDEAHHVITTTPNGASQIHENWTLDANGHIKADGQVPPNLQDQFKGAGFDIQSHVEKQPVTFNNGTPLVQDDLPGLHHNVNVPSGTGWIHSDPNDPNKWNLVVNQHPDQVLVHNASVTPDGQSITYDSAHSPFGENAFSTRTIELEPAHDSTKEVFGSEGLWSKESTPIDHREWYGNNTNYSDLNELRAYNSVFTTGGQKGIDWDMSHMTPDGSFETGNHPDIINAQEAISHGRAALAFSTPDHQQDPIIITDASDGVIDGHFRLDPNDFTHHIGGPDHPESMTVGEFSRMVVDQQKLSQFPDGSLASELNNHQDLFTLGKDGKPGFIEAGRLTEVNGKTVFQPFATAQGTGQAPSSISIHVPARTDTVIEFHPKPVEFDHTITEIIPPSDHEIPIIPWVITPRFPLEPLVESGGVYYGYFEPMTEERKQLFESNRSKTLKENPKAKLDPYKETEEYFARQKPEYVEEIKALVATIPQPMLTTVKTVVGIPVAGHEEGPNIYNSLLNYTFQEADKNSYEIMLFVNHPEGTTLDNTISEIDRFKKDHPDMPIRTIYKQLPRDKAKMAVIRKYLNDVALYRHQQNGPSTRDIILISNDADLKGISPSYIQNFIEKLDDKEIDGMVGQLDWDPESYIEYPAIHAGTRLFQYLNLLIWNGKHGDRPSSGANFAFKGSIYAGIGGYQINDMPGAEDVILGQAIRAARGGGSTLGYAGANVSRLYTSSRRAIDAWNKGFAPIEQWDRNWGIINDSIRRHALGEHVTVNYDDPSQMEKLKTDLNLVIGRTLDYYKDQDGNLENPTFKKAMSWLGLKYKLNSKGEVEITDMNAFIEGIKRYQQYGLVLQQVKSGKLPKSALKELETAPSTTSSTRIDPFMRSTPRESSMTTFESSIETSPKTITFSADTSETQGARDEMEDAHIIVQNFGGRSDQIFAAVYDGHKGRESADIAASVLHTHLSENLVAGKKPDEALKLAYSQTDQEIVDRTESGATAITAFVAGSKLYTANAGDARAVLSRDGTALRLSKDHKASDPDEIRRVEALGGKVVPNRPGGILRVMGELAVARALGDSDLKPYVTSDPLIVETDLQKNDNFLILACDGIWDVISDQEAIDLIKDEENPKKAGEMLMNKALEKGSGDNITVTVLRFNRPTPPAPGTST